MRPWNNGNKIHKNSKEIEIAANIIVDAIADIQEHPGKQKRNAVTDAINKHNSTGAFELPGSDAFVAHVTKMLGEIRKGTTKWDRESKYTTGTDQVYDLVLHKLNKTSARGDKIQVTVEEICTNDNDADKEADTCTEEVEDHNDDCKGQQKANNRDPWLFIANECLSATVQDGKIVVEMEVKAWESLF